MTLYDLNASAQPGERYTMSFSYSATVPVPADVLQDAVSTLMAAFLRNPVVSADGTLGGHIDITFGVPYLETFGTLAPLFISAFDVMDVPGFTVNYIQTSDAGGGLVSTSACGINNPGACFSDVKTVGYLLIAILALVVIVKVT